MRVIVRLPAVLRPDAGGAARLDIPLPDGATLGDLLATLTNEHPRLARRLRDERGELRRYVNVFVDGHECRTHGGLTAPLKDESEIQVLPSVAGG